MFICCISGGSFEFCRLIVIKFLLTLYNRIEHLHVLLQWLKFGF